MYKCLLVFSFELELEHFANEIHSIWDLMLLISAERNQF